MCGISGYVDASAPTPPGVLERMGACLCHRGPDDEGLYRSPDGCTGLAFRRLAIIDVSAAGHQPMSSGAGDCWIVFNGEVYNYAELRPELEARGHVFRSKTDTEVVLRAYMEWGPRCVDRFIGMFAFAIWDAPRRRLFAARDRLGIKPLYYADRGGRLVFGSELKPLIVEGAAGGALDATALGEFLARGYISAPRTVYAGVRALPPAHTLAWEAGTVTVERYWDPLDWVGRRAPATDDVLADELDEMLRSAVRYRLISDVPLGAFLSGGVDSSLVVALMRAVSTADVRTFTVGFAERAVDESSHAAAVARHLGTVHTTMTVSEREAQAVVPLLPAMYDEPFADSSQIPTYLVSALTRRHVTVALSGDGGDELFAGYQNHQRVAELEPFWALPAPLRRAAGALGRLIPGHRVGRRLSGLVADSPLAYAEEAWRLTAKADAERLMPALAGIADSRDRAYDAARFARPGLGFLDRMMLSDLERYLPNDVLTKVDRASMSASLEARVPLLDHRVVQFALGLPLDAKWRHGRGKFLLRRVLSRYVPDALIDRPKQGFGVPLAGWLRGELRPTLEAHLAPDRLAVHGLLEPTAVGGLVDTFLRGGGGAESVWSLLVLQMWLERYHAASPVRLA